MDLPEGINNIVDPRKIIIRVTDEAGQEALLRDIDFDTIEPEEDFVDNNEFIVRLTAAPRGEQVDEDGDPISFDIEIVSDVLLDGWDLPGLRGLIQRYMESRE